MKKESGNKKRSFLKIAGLFLIATALSGFLVFAYDVNSSRTKSYKESEKKIDTRQILSTGFLCLA